MRKYENELIATNVSVIAGTDEVGRGPLAGPLVAAAVILPNDFNHELVRDSKTLNGKQLLAMDKLIREIAISFAIKIIDVETIDKVNVKVASRMAMADAVKGLSIKPQHVLVDFETIPIDIPQTGITKGDAKSISIAAASIIAKVARDKMMIALDKDFPAYCFKQNVGYGTKVHLAAIAKEGWTIHHRKSFNPVKTLIKKRP